MDLSVIIVNFNVRAFLENALASVQRSLGGLRGEIFVVDNASDDGSVEMVRQKFPDVTVIANTANLGFAAANNLALRGARGRYVLLLNPDTILQEDTLATMTAFMDDHPDAGVAGCKVLNPDGTLQLACRRSFPTPWVAFTKIVGLSALFPHSRTFGRYNLTYLDPGQTAEVEAVSGSFMMIRRDACDAVGGLDEQFFLYGEDLDWCFRFKQAGWKIYYVHATQIVHYKGESARRSDIDEVKLFYEAMRLFVRKHFRRGLFSDAVLRLGIGLREWAAFAARIARPLRAAALDFILVNVSLFLGELIWFGELFRFPAYAYPVLTTVPWLIIAGTMYFSGVYTTRKLSVSRTMSSVLIGYVIISALTFFFKQYGFSRMVVLIAGAITLVALPGWRVLARLTFRQGGSYRMGLFGRRTVIVGVERSGQELLLKLRARVVDGYDVVGFVDVGRKRIGEKVSGVEILGSIDNIGKVLGEQRATEVIFSTDALSYAEILSVIGRSRNRGVNFRLVPNSLEVIIGKAHIDQLDDLPLVDIEYNIHRLGHRIVKRLFDIAGSLLLLATVFPWSRLAGRNAAFGRSLPHVLKGTMSLVGPPAAPASPAAAPYLGKPGMTGLVQIHYREDLTAAEIENYNLFYAKNQSLLLDAEILVKSLFLALKK